MREQVKIQAYNEEKKMAQTASIMLPLGTKASGFNLLDTSSGQMVSLPDLTPARATVIMFICNHCPYVIHLIKDIVTLAQEYQPKEIQFIAISSNDVINYPADAPDKMKEFAHKYFFPFPYLYDETQITAKNYHAACTPDFYVFDNELKCVYRGCFDDSTPGNGQPVTGKNLRAALDAVLEGKQVDENQKASVGCGIKWKK
jgi:peroxiredoxin